MQVNIIIKQDNAAFADGENGTETARILREMADYCDGYNIEGISKTYTDINRNKVASLNWEW